MRIGLQTWGTDGDILPFIALANTLKKRGIRVALAYTSIDGKAYQAEGIEMIPANDAINFDPNSNPYAMGKRPGSFSEYTALIRNYFDPFTESMFRASEDLCKKSTLVVGHSICHTLQTASELYNCPRVAIALTPQIVRSDSFSPTGGSFGHTINALMWKLGDMLSSKVWFDQGNRIRVQNGLKPIKSLQENLFTSPLLTLVAASSTFISEPPDWNSNVKMSGFLSPETSIEKEIPPLVANFIEQGEAPIYMTFGSCMQYNEKQFTELLVNAAIRSGKRAIIQSEFNHPFFDENQSLLRIERVSHSVVFPLCELIVHHGGAGTTQSALKAGRPSIVVSHGFDQPYWAELLFRAGVGGIPMSIDVAHPNDLAENICEVTSDSHIKEKAASVGKNLEYEKGVEKAADLILEKMLS